MMICPTSTKSVVLLLLVALCTWQAHCLVVSVSPNLTEGAGLLYTHMVEAGPSYDPRFIWSPVHVLVNCSSPAFSVLTASSLEKLTAESATKVLWCGWKNILDEPNVCELRFSMFRSTYFAVKPAQPSLLSLGQQQLSCSVTVPDRVDRDIQVGVVLTGAAVALFVQAGRLAQSQAFRLTTGGLMGVTGAAAVILFVLMRNTPAKRAIGVGCAISASGMWGIVRWAFGTWAPGVQQVVFSRVGLWYVIITGTAGVAVAFWMDDPANHKINTTIRVALQILALGTLYCAVADEYAALAALALLVCYGWLWAILRHLYLAARWVAGLLQWLQFKLGGGPARPFGDSDGEHLEFPLLYEEPSYRSSEDDDYSPTESADADEASGGMDTEGGEDDSGEAGEEQGQPPAGQRHTAAGVQPAAAAPGTAASRWAWLGFGRVDGGTSSVTHGEELDSAPSFDQWAQQGGSRQQQPPPSHAAAAAARPSNLAGAGSAGDAAAGRAPGPSSGGWGSATVAVDRQQHQPQQPVVLRPRPASPWQETGKVVDLTQPKPRSPPAGPPAAGAGAGSSRPSAAAAAAAPASAAASRTPGGSRRVVNPETGREISTTGSTFKELLARGYEYSAATNTLQLSALPSPPSAAGANVRGAPTPASNLRSRRSGKAQ